LDKFLLLRLYCNRLNLTLEHALAACCKMTLIDHYGFYNIILSGIFHMDIESESVVLKAKHYKLEET
jgi:hypothetical protein